MKKPLIFILIATLTLPCIGLLQAEEPVAQEVAVKTPLEPAKRRVVEVSMEEAIFVRMKQAGQKQAAQKVSNRDSLNEQEDVLEHLKPTDYQPKVNELFDALY